MTHSVLSTIGIKSCFDTCHIINEIANQVILHQIE